MITKERLNEIEDVLSKTTLEFSRIVEEEEEKEILRLARLGLWARDHAKPALEEIKTGERPFTLKEFREKADLALAAFPKETK